MSYPDHFPERLKYVFARYLKEYRIENNLTRAELAKLIMTTDDELKDLESEKSFPDEATFFSFLALLKKEKTTAFISEVQEEPKVEWSPFLS